MSTQVWHWDDHVNGGRGGGPNFDGDSESPLFRPSSTTFSSPSSFAAMTPSAAATTKDVFSSSSSSTAAILTNGNHHHNHRLQNQNQDSEALPPPPPFFNHHNRYLPPTPSSTNSTTTFSSSKQQQQQNFSTNTFYQHQNQFHHHHHHHHSQQQHGFIGGGGGGNHLNHHGGGFNDHEFPSLLPTSNNQNHHRTPVYRIVPNGGVVGTSSSGGLPSASSQHFARSRSVLGRAAGGYSNLIKDAAADHHQQSNTTAGFQIHIEDFPALPQSQKSASEDNDNNDNGGGSPSDSTRQESTGAALTTSSTTGGENKTEQQAKTGIQTYIDGTVTGIPAGMLNDQFGMAGLLTVIRAVATDPPSHSSFPFGQDLTMLGIDLNTTEKNLYQTFSGPWGESTCRFQDIDCLVPPEYITNAAITENLAPIKLNRYGEDLLFYLFYNFTSEMFQLAAAAELYNRDWRYHKEQRLWIARAPGVEPLERTATYENGTYYIFDPNSWRKVQKELHLDYSKLEARPMLPPHQQQHLINNHLPAQSAAVGSASSAFPSAGGARSTSSS